MEKSQSHCYPTATTEQESHIKLLILVDGVQFDTNFDRSNSEFLGNGAFGVVYQIKYGGTPCAAKQQGFRRNPAGSAYTIQDFQRECLLHSKLHHPNIVKMYGVCYHSERPDQPIKVMELMKGGTLSSVVSRCQNIPMYVKLSILQDVGRGLHYLHSCSPPIIHCHIGSSVILLTTSLTAKIGSFTFSKEFDPCEPGFGTRHQSPILHDGTSLDVFSFGYVVCRVVSQQFFGRLYHYTSNPNSDRPSIEFCIGHRQQYMDHMTQGPLKDLAMKCLDDDPKKRPSMSSVCSNIDSILKGKHDVFRS